MHRRHFLKSASAALALSAVPSYAQQIAQTRKRVALIGSGWYGKSDLFRLIQVSPVEVVSICDPDKKMSAQAAGLGANAVIGVDLDYENLGANGGMLMVTAAGTAVVYE